MPPRRLAALAAALLSLVAAPPAATQAPPPPPAPLQIVFLDVGQGDATLLRTPDGHAILVDGGRSMAALEALQALGIDSLDLVVATHPDEDHVRGLAPVVGRLRVRELMMGDGPCGKYSNCVLEGTARKRGTARVPPVAGTRRFGALALHVLPPPPRPFAGSNNNSIGLLVEYGAFRALLTGDAEREELDWFLSGGVPRVQLLKASHHGALNGLTPGWIRATQPAVVVISCGRDNAYGHPDPLALRYYARYAREIRRTDQEGHVVVKAEADGRLRVEARADLGALAGVRSP